MILIRLFIINTGLTLTLSIVSSPLRWRESDVMTATKGVSDQRGVWSCWNVYKLKVQRVIN